MPETKTDKLALRIAARRAAAQRPTTRKVDVPDEAFPATGPEIHDPANSEQIEAVRAAMQTGANPMTIARLLGGIVGQGMQHKRLAAALHKSGPWLSKRLALLNAPIDVQRLIERGALAESEYHNNRPHIASRIKGSAGALKYQRMPTITISIEAARSLAAILQVLANQHGAAPIRLDLDSKKTLTAILNIRAGEIKALLK